MWSRKTLQAALKRICLLSFENSTCWNSTKFYALNCFSTAQAWIIFITKNQSDGVLRRDVLPILFEYLTINPVKFCPYILKSFNPEDNNVIKENFASSFKTYFSTKLWKFYVLKFYEILRVELFFYRPSMNHIHNKKSKWWCLEKGCFTDSLWILNYKPCQILSIYLKKF